MKKAWLFLFLGLTIFLMGLIGGILIGQTVYGGEVTLAQLQQPTVSADRPTIAPDSPFIVNINTASLDLLDTLPGIGPAIAQRILDYRQMNGPFQTKEDLLKVSGIGKEKLNAIYDLITVEDSNENSGS